MHEQNAIKSMPLYVDVERINNELAALGIGVDEALTPAQLFPFDQYHYHGTDAVHNAVHRLGLGPASHVLDVGSGLGGPARYLASTIGCHITALELQSDLHATATRLTARCGLGQHVTHVWGDALTAAFPDATFNAIVSWLALLHIPERPRLLARLARMLQRGGQCYIEDLFQRAPFARSDLHNRAGAFRHKHIASDPVDLDVLRKRQAGPDRRDHPGLDVDLRQLPDGPLDVERGLVVGRQVDPHAGGESQDNVFDVHLLILCQFGTDQFRIVQALA